MINAVNERSRTSENALANITESNFDIVDEKIENWEEIRVKSLGLRIENAVEKRGIQGKEGIFDGFF